LKEAVSLAEDVPFFDRPLDQCRWYNDVFNDMSLISLVKYVYRGLAMEMFWDIFSSSVLCIAYTPKMVAMTKHNLEEDHHWDRLLEFNKNKHSK